MTWNDRRCDHRRVPETTIKRTVIQGCHVATCDPNGSEYSDGHVIVEDGRIVAVGAGGAPASDHAPGVSTETIDGRGRLLTPGLINTHHHLYQWATRGVSQDETLFGWLTTLYPIWAGIDEQVVHAAAAAGLGWLALTGCTTSSDHHYVFPERGGDLLEAEISAARRIGLRFHPARGSMDLGQSDGGLPPDSVVEERDAILAATEAAIDRYNDPAEESLLRIVVGPCSPFSVTGELMREAAGLARRKGVRLHTHLAETIDEEDYCRERFGCSPAEYAEQLGWLGDDVWMAHCVHLSDEAIDRFAQTHTGVAHCPTSNGRLGSGIAPLRSMLNAGVPVGLGVDGAASNESGRMLDELHQALLLARLRDGPLALSAREALHTATVGGARCLGRERELGSIEPGKLADLALWQVDGLAGDGIADPLCTLVFGAATLDRLLVGGRELVSDGHLLSADEEQLAQAAKWAAETLEARAAA
jgi:cytosine/adenosine deaminase-related metal-dependent hydrolase